MCVGGWRMGEEAEREEEEESPAVEATGFMEHLCSQRLLLSA